MISQPQGLRSNQLVTTGRGKVRPYPLAFHCSSQLKYPLVSIIFGEYCISDFCNSSSFPCFQTMVLEQRLDLWHALHYRPLDFCGLLGGPTVHCKDFSISPFFACRRANAGLKDTDSCKSSIASGYTTPFPAV